MGALASSVLYGVGPSEENPRSRTRRGPRPRGTSDTVKLIDKPRVREKRIGSVGPRRGLETPRTPDAAP